MRWRRSARGSVGLLPSLLGLVGGPDLFRQLVPLHAVAHLRAKPPLERLGLRLYRGPQLIEPRADELAIYIHLGERGAQLRGVDLKRAVHTPLIGRHPRDVSGIDDLVAPPPLYAA